MADYSILTMLQRRVSEALARREPFPAGERALRQRLEETRIKLRQCLGEMPREIVPPQPGVEAAIHLGGTGIVQERIVYRTEEDVRVPAHLYRPAVPVYRPYFTTYYYSPYYTYRVAPAPWRSYAQYDGYVVHRHFGNGRLTVLQDGRDVTETFRHGSGEYKLGEELLFFFLELVLSRGII